MWIFHHTATSNVWQPWDPELEVRLNIQTQLAIHLRTPATRRPGAIGANAWSRLTKQERDDKLSPVSVKGQYVEGS